MVCRCLVGCPERVVDVEQRLLLPLGEPGVGEDGQLDRADLAVVEVQDPGADVERLRRDAEPFRELLQHLCRGPAQPAFDLAQVRVRDTGLLGQLPQRELRRDPLLAQVVAEGLDGLPDSELCHASIVLTPASRCKPRGREADHSAHSYDSETLGTGMHAISMQRGSTAPIPVLRTPG